MSVKEGESLKILQKHDDNQNDEWWLLERVVVEIPVEKDVEKITEEAVTAKTSGYVPSNYIQLIYRAEIKSDSSDLVVLYND